MEIIFDEIMSLEQQQRILKLAQKFKSFKTISDNKLDGSKNNFVFFKYIGSNKILFNKRCFNLFIYNFFLLHKLSLSEKTNLFPFITMLVKEFLNMKQFLVVFLEIICFRKDPTLLPLSKIFCLKNMVETKPVVHNEFFFI